MRIKTVGAALMAALSLGALAGAGAASASTWDPQGVVVHGHGTLTLTTNRGSSVECTVTVNVKATGDLAQTTNAAGTPAGPTFSNCSNSISPFLSTAVHS